MSGINQRKIESVAVDIPQSCFWSHETCLQFWLTLDCPNVSQSAPGCVTCHTCHASVTHFRPISGNIVEVTLMTPPIMYINSHTRNLLSLARISTMIPPYHL